MKMQLISVGLSFLVLGCANAPSNDVSKYGPVPLIDLEKGKEAKVIDILALLGEPLNTNETAPTYIRRLDRAIEKVVGNTNTNTKLRRNMILDRMIHASNELCEDYKTTLKKKHSNANFLYGASTLALGGLGGAVSGANAARNLSSLSAISSGMRAEHNQTFYSDQSSQVIVKAIELRRSSMLEALNVARQCNVEAYSIPMAMADAVKYHGSCSLVGGLAQIDNALSSSTNLKAGTEALASNAFFQEYLTTTSRTFTVTTTVSATPTTPTFASQTSVLSALQYCQDTKVDANKKP